MSPLAGVCVLNNILVTNALFVDRKTNHVILKTPSKNNVVIVLIAWRIGKCQYGQAQQDKTEDNFSHRVGIGKPK